MPTYAYACTACDHRFDTQQAFTDDALTECPECEGRLRKLFNAVGIVFKGSGFYRNDSRSSNGAKSASGSSESDNGSSAKESTKESSSAGTSTKESASSSSTSTSGTSTSGGSGSGSGQESRSSSSSKATSAA